jgi:hypothetical protein
MKPKGMRDLLIVQLGLAGVPGATIRKIVGCSMEKVKQFEVKD